jgi:V/A-type H+-transporting ATPase subunit D
MTDTPPTRSALLDLQDKRALAEKGHNLLEKKRDALIHKFFDLIDEYKDIKQTAYDELQQGYKTLHKTQAINGVDVVRSVGFSQPKTISIETGTENLMGVTVPDYKVTRNDMENNTSQMDIDQSLADARMSFTDIAELLIQLAEVEETIHTLADAIQRTKRRVNSLEHVKIPEMKTTEEAIEQKLMEKERERFVSLKQLK